MKELIVKEHTYILTGGESFSRGKTIEPRHVSFLKETLRAELSVTADGNNSAGFVRMVDCLLFEELEDFVMFKLKWGNKIKSVADVVRLVDGDIQ